MSSMAWRAVAAAIFLATMTFPANAQRGGSRGGFAAHTAAGAHSGFASSHSYLSVPRYGASRAAPPALNGRSAPAALVRRSVYSGPYRYRRPYRPVYAGAAVYGVPVYAAPDYWGYPDLGFYDDSAAAEPAVPYPSPDDSAVAPLPAEPLPPVERAEASPADTYRPAYVSPGPEPPVEPATTLVYKNGRPSEQIHNYLLTAKTLYVLDSSRRREIPLDEVDLAATQKVNQEAGVDFQVPTAAR